MDTYHQVTDDHDHHEDEETHALTRDLHAVPHGLNPFTAQHPEDDQEGVEEVVHVPAGQLAFNIDLTHTVFVALAKQLHTHHGKDEDDDGQHQSQVSQGSHRVTNDLDQHVEGGP